MSKDLEKLLEEIVSDEKVPVETRIELIKDFKKQYADVMMTLILSETDLKKHNENLKLYDDAVLKLEEK